MKNKKKINLKKDTQQSVNTRFEVAKVIVAKNSSKYKTDVQYWKSTLFMANNVDNPKVYPYYNLLKDMMVNTHTTSQINNRKLKTHSADFAIKDAKGNQNQELTDLLSQSKWFNDVIDYILESRFFGYTLVELGREGEDVKVNLIPRTNVISRQGRIYPDYTEDKFIEYKQLKEYGTWLLDFGEEGDLGIINNAMPDMIFSKFAQSCWAEFCEIYGIPPRVLKTNTTDPKAKAQAEKMMKDMGNAAWVIIDQSEQLEWTNTLATGDGSVYEKFITLCRNNISLLISGAVLGQDTKNGSNAKEKSSMEILKDIVEADKKRVTQYMNDKVIPALYMIGVLLSQDVSFEYEKEENKEELWQRTVGLLNVGKDVDNDWIKGKFGIEVKDKKNDDTKDNKLAFAPEDFY